MPVSAHAVQRLAAIPNGTVLLDTPLAEHTRFAIGGPAAVLFDGATIEAFMAAMQITRDLNLPAIVIGGGSNLIVSDAGFDGVILRFTGSKISLVAPAVVRVESGAVLQDLVDWAINHDLSGLETMTGIPGFVGGAVYGNAGAYGRSIHEFIGWVVATDGSRTFQLNREECRFQYRESIFKKEKDWIILSADLRLSSGNREELVRTAQEIRTVRDAKYPPTMKCAGSIFKNLLLSDLPAAVRAEIPTTIVREGKVPSAWFLEQAGGKGLRRGGIQVASYHANLIYNEGNGTADDLLAVIKDLHDRVRARFGFDLEEEVQFVGFDLAVLPAV